MSNCKKEDEKPITEDEIVDNVNSTYKKIETLFVEGDNKVETVATIDNDSLNNAIQEKWAEKPQKVHLKSGGIWVGVIKSGSCGSFDEFRIYMDCEDSRNRDESNGWIGDFVVNSNVTWTFCDVPGEGFINLGSSFAVLQLYNLFPYYQLINRHFDNEDSNNGNSLYLSNPSMSIGMNQGTHGPDSGWTELVFMRTANYDGNSIFPSFAYNGLLHYGVFGDLNNDGQGYIVTDDEDSNNSNWLRSTFFSTSTTVTYNQTPLESIPGIIIGGSNTRVYITQAR